MIVRAYDRSHRMMRSRKLRAFNKQSIGDIVTQLCQDHGISASLHGSTGSALEYVIQHNESDWDFMWRLLDRIGFEFVLDDKSATIAKPGATGDTVELRFPDDIPSFRPRV